MWFASLILAGLSLGISLLFLFNAKANNLVSGPLRPMRLLATAVAKGMGDSLKKSPLSNAVVLLTQETHSECEKPVIASSLGSFKGDRVYVVLSYLENSPSLCETLYGNAIPGSAPGATVTLTETSGHNYGAKVAFPAQVVAVGYSFVRFPDDLPSVLDWRTNEDPLYSLEGRVQVEESFTRGIELSLRSTELQPVLGWRDLVAERHAMVEAVLRWIMALLTLAVVISAFGLWSALARRRLGQAGDWALGPLPVAASPESRSWRRRQRGLLHWIALDALIAIILLLVRLTPTLTDWMAGPAHTVRALAAKIAELTIKAEGTQFPVILMDKEETNCAPVQDAGVIPQPNAIYYVVSYSESQTFSCWTAYVTPMAGVVPDTAWVTLRPGEGKNYGRELPGEVRVAPFARNLKLYNPVYLGLLDWSTRPPSVMPRSFVAAKNFPPGQRPLDLGQVQIFDMKVSLAEMRAQVARNHDRVVSLLDAGVVLSFLGLVILSARAWRLYEQFSSQSRAVNAMPSWSVFLAADPDLLLAVATLRHKQRQEQLREQARQDSLMRRAREDVEERLRGLLQTLSDENQRERIRECLNDQATTLEQMEALWRESQSHAASPAPEERLDALLESSREYCNEEEFEQARATAFNVLERSGFREARDFAVRLHDDLRRRAKAQQEKERIKEEKEQGGAP